VDKLKILLEAERAHVESLRMALSMLELATESRKVPYKKNSSTPKQSPFPKRKSVLQRLFKR